MFTFSNYRSFSRFLLSICLVSLPICSVGEVILKDGFESGDRLYRSGPARWWVWDRPPDPEVTTDKPRSGSHSLKFAYPGDGPDNPVSPDSSKEQRFGLGGQYQEIWIKFDLFIPGNYKHREAYPKNNKFMYLDDHDGTQFVGFEIWPTYDFKSDYIPVHLQYGGVDRGHNHEGQRAPFVQNSSDLNRWHEWIVHAKLATSSSSNDGAVEMWKNGEKVMEYLNLPNYNSVNNYFERGYVLGWANSGFDETTTFYIDDFVISTTPLVPKGGEAPPNPPVLGAN